MSTETGREKRHRRIRRKVIGTSEKPRLSVHRSHKHLYVQLIDDLNSKSLLLVSTLDSEFAKKQKYGGNIKAANLLGELLAQKAKELKLTRVVFDRGGYLYHGRVKTLAETARKHGLEF